jgi:hypothetical protein
MDTTITDSPTEPQTTRSRTDRVYRMLASKIDARRTCFARNTGGADTWFERHTYAIEQIARDVLPSGSGIDSGTKVDLDRSTGEKIVLLTSFHHMDEYGGYDGWTEHTITVRASLIHTIALTISGPDRNGIKEYLAEVFAADLQRYVTETYDPATETSTYRVSDETEVHAEQE